MAELPHIGKHCNVDMCNRLDFLPVKCDACKGSFCIDHFTYDAHECEQAYQKNVQVPICPLCNNPVPTPKGISSDVQVNEHIQNNCEIQKKKKIFNNRCSSKGCKKKELIPITCSSCNENFCLSHRHERDHSCTGRGLSKAARAAMHRNSVTKRDEQLARELDESLNVSVHISNEERDRRLAEQLQQEEYHRNARGRRPSQSTRNGCLLS